MNFPIVERTLHRIAFKKTLRLKRQEKNTFNPSLRRTKKLLTEGYVQ